MRENERNQSDVGYQTSGTEERSRPTGSRQFKGKNMPQGNTMKKSVSKKDVKSMIKKSEAKDKKEDAKMIKKKAMSMVSDERIAKHAKRMKRGV